MRVAGLPYLPVGTPWPRRTGNFIWTDGEEAWPSGKLFPCASAIPRLSGSAQPATSTPTAVMIRCMDFKTVSVPQAERPMSSSVAQSPSGLPLGERAFDLPLKGFQEGPPSLGMLSFDEAALFCAVIENALHPISIEANNSVNRA